MRWYSCATFDTQLDPVGYTIRASRPINRCSLKDPPMVPRPVLLSYIPVLLFVSLLLARMMPSPASAARRESSPYGYGGRTRKRARPFESPGCLANRRRACGVLKDPRRHGTISQSPFSTESSLMPRPAVGAFLYK